MTITKKMLAKNPFLVRKIEKVASVEKMSFSEAANFLVLRWFHLHSFYSRGETTRNPPAAK